jgi:hypothetical protein
MRQTSVYVRAIYNIDLTDEINKKIDEQFKAGYYLFDIQYFGIEGEDCYCHAFLLFHEFNVDYEERCYGERELDTRCSKAQGGIKGNSRCQERGKDSCCKA